MSGHEVTEMRQSGAGDSEVGGAAIAILAADHAVVSWNLAAELLTGYSLDTLNAIGWARVFEPTGAMQQILEKARTGPFTLGARLQLRKHDGELLPVDVRCSPLRSRGGAEPWLALALLAVSPAPEDRHDRGHPGSLGRLASFLSHEIRNPLNAISLHLDILDEELCQTTSGDRTQINLSLKTIQTEIGRLHGLMQDFLSLTRLTDIQREPEDVRMFLQAVARDVQDQLTARGIIFHLEGLEELGEASFHKATLHRALLNVVQQAAAMSPEGTLILRAWRTSSYLHFAIHQPGRHLEADAVPQESGTAQTLAIEETDFALYVAQAIVRAHGGALVASRKPSQGTMFTVTLPYA